MGLKPVGSLSVRGMEEDEWRDDASGKGCGASEPILSICDCVVGGSELPISKSDSSSSLYRPGERIVFGIFSFITGKWNVEELMKVTVILSQTYWDWL